MGATESTPKGKSDDVRVRVFVDFWNFQIRMRERRSDFSVDWKQMGPWLARKAGEVYLAAGHEGRARYEGMHIYLSHDPKKQADDGLRKWATNTLDRFPGVEVVMKERRPKDPRTARRAISRSPPAPPVQQA